MINHEGGGGVFPSRIASYKEYYSHTIEPGMPGTRSFHLPDGPGSEDGATLVAGWASRTHMAGASGLMEAGFLLFERFEIVARGGVDPAHIETHQQVRWLDTSGTEGVATSGSIHRDLTNARARVIPIGVGVRLLGTSGPSRLQRSWGLGVEWPVTHALGTGTYAHASPDPAVQDAIDNAGYWAFPEVGYRVQGRASVRSGLADNWIAGLVFGPTFSVDRSVERAIAHGIVLGLRPEVSWRTGGSWWVRNFHEAYGSDNAGDVPTLTRDSELFSRIEDSGGRWSGEYIVTSTRSAGFAISLYASWTPDPWKRRSR